MGDFLDSASFIFHFLSTTYPTLFNHVSTDIDYFRGQRKWNDEKIKSNGVEPVDTGGVQGLREDSLDSCA